MRLAVITRPHLNAAKPGRAMICCWIAAVGLLDGSLRLIAQDTALSSITNREIQRRQSQVLEAQAQLSEASLLQQKGQHEAATRLLFKTHEALPQSPLAADVNNQILAALVDASCAWADDLLAQGRKADAIRVLEAVLAPTVCPGDPQVVKLLEQANDPERHAPALTPEHIARVKKVEALLIYAASAYDLGNLDGAISSYNQVLRLDPYNVAARRGLEKVEQYRAQYQEAARDHGRSKMLGQVSSQWEDQVPPATDITALLSSSGGGGLVTKSKRERLEQKLRTLRVPKLQFVGAALDEVIEFMRLATVNVDPEGTGISFVLNVDADTKSRSISLDLLDVPVDELLRYVTQLTGTASRVEENAVVITSLTEKSINLITKQYRVPPDFIQKGEIGGVAAASADPFAPAPATAGGLLIKRLGAKEFLESRGVTFGDGASASYSASSSTLIVRNTADNLGLIDLLVEQSIGAAPKQAIISVKMIAVDQKNYEELGFDVALSQANVPGNDRVFFSGGANGSSAKAEGSGSGASAISPYPLTTAGLRSSGAVMGVPGIAELISQTGDTVSTNSVSPGQFRLVGVFSDPQFDVLTRMVSQHKGTDVIVAPSILAKTGQKAEVHVVREFPYPTEFDPPQIPQQVGQASVIARNAQGLVTTNANSSGPVTPATPTNFETKELGVILEVEPVISADGRTVELSLAPSLTDFEGFIDYGSDISNAIDNVSFDGGLFAFVTTPGTRYIQANDILQPVFRKTSANTSVTVYDGSTVVLGGVIEERRIDIQDKVPLVGDIPLIGRLWQTKLSQTTKKNVLFFVTVTVVDPSGQRVNQVAASQAAQ